MAAHVLVGMSGCAGGGLEVQGSGDRSKLVTVSLAFVAVYVLWGKAEVTFCQVIWTFTSYVLL